MADTNRLVLPLLAAAQAQKHVTVNEALKLLDAIVQAGVIDKDLTSPPGSPSEGDIYIVGGSATGAWAGQDDDLAIYQDGAWVFVTPLSGWIAWVNDETTLYVYNSGSWQSLAGILGAGYLSTGGGTLTGNLVLEEATPSIRFNDTDLTGYTLLQTIGSVMQLAVDAENDDASSSFDVTIDGGSQLFRVNEHGVGVGGASADASNQLAVFGTAALFNSSGSFSFKFNKNAAANDAAMSFQTGFTAYALVGLLGDNDFTIKVGTGATTALVIDESTAAVQLTEHPKFSGYLNFGQNYTAGSWTDLLMNNLRHNDQGDAAISSNVLTFTAPHDGYYIFGVGATFENPGTTPTKMQVGLSINSAAPTADTIGTTGDAAFVSGETSCNATAMLKLSAGDTVEPQIFFTTNNGRVLADENYFWGAQIA